MEQQSNETKQFRVRKFLAFCVLCLLLLCTSVNAQYVHTNGTKILDENGKDLFFTGINLGNWLLWEGYLMMGDFNFRTHTQFFDGVKKAFGNDLTKAIEFEHQWRLNYVSEKAIQDLKQLGFNSVRVPFHHNLFWDGSQVTNRGFVYLDRVIDYCRTYGMYVLLDMHAAPGYQNPGDHSDNVNSNAGQPRETVKFWDGNNVSITATIWKHIAQYYKNEPVVWGYDLINEPVPQPGREFELLPSLIEITNAIRQVDNNHIIVAEGSWWGSDMQKLDWTDSQVQSQSGVSSRWDNNLVYQTHHYSNDVSLLDGRLAICNKLNVPMILGEYGESDMGNLRNMTNWCIDNDVDYFPWSFKKMSHDKCLWTIPPNNAYNELKNAINSNSVGPSNLYANMINFAKNNIKNGHSSHTWHQDFYDAVKNNNGPSGCGAASATALPGKVQVENFCDMSGIQTENTSDVGGGQNVGWIDNGDWLDIRVNVPSSGTYKVKFRVAADGSATKSIQLRKGSSNLGTVSFTASGGWQTWKTVSKDYNLSEGNQTLRLYFSSSSFNLNWVEFTTGSTCDPTAITAYMRVNDGSWQSTSSLTVTEGDKVGFGPHPTSGGSWTWSGPGGFSSSQRTPEVSNIQTNRAGSYTATYTNNCGAQSTKNFSVSVNTAPATLPSPWQNADIGNVSATGSASFANGVFTVKGSGENIYGTSDEFHYVYQNQSGNKEIVAKVESMTNVNTWTKAGVMFRDNLNATAKFVMVYQRPDNQVVMQWRTGGGGSVSSESPVGGTGSVKYLKLRREGNNFTGYYSTNGSTYTAIKTISVSIASNCKVGLGVTSRSDGDICTAKFSNVDVSAVSSSTFAVTIQAENYFDMSGVQTENTLDVGGGQNVGWLNSGDWMGYTVNLPSSGTYTIEYRVASPNGSGTLNFERFGGGTHYGSISIPNTGGWQSWTTISHSVNLSAGSQDLAIAVVNGGWNINWFRITEGVKSAARGIEGDLKPAISFYPNPVSDMLYIRGMEQAGLIEVYSISGSKVAENFGESIDMGNLGNGVYFVRLHETKGVSQIKVVKR